MPAFDTTSYDSDFFDKANYFLSDFDASTIHDQSNLCLYLEFCRLISWDIPSALASLCSHLDLDDYFMHRPAILTFGDGWTTLDRHFFDIHNLDLTDQKINWSFDT